jgi:hypothetical protein
MPPGSSWRDTEGFTLVPFDFSQREVYVENMRRRNAAKLAAQLELEARTTGNFAAFEGYFKLFFRSIPWIIRRNKLPPVVFRVIDAGGAQNWLADPRQGAVSVVESAPPDTVVYEVHASVLNDCANLKMFSVWTASKRIKIRLPSAGALSRTNLWFTLFDMYETDLLPIAKNFTLRALGVRMRRWREPVEVANILLRRIFLRQRFSVSRIYPIGSNKLPA